MQVQFYNDLFNVITSDTTLSSIWSPNPVRALYNRADQDEAFPYIVYKGKFTPEKDEDYAVCTAFITFEIYDFGGDATRTLQIANRLSTLLNRGHMTHGPDYYALRFFLVSNTNLPDKREDVIRQELIFKIRYYDGTLADTSNTII